ncbi:hypothetical protein ACFRJ9_11170 [Paenarthrobacter sp. NPDC056912]|uniref:hypothetical protein n=1 Tax=Paenarthrobacter sp. NPDC056912 TaxID=3345965 RepID=UPI00366A9DB1
MDFLVCGDFFSITCGTWIALLNGFVGASVAAVLGALVALGVVILTNRFQRKQSAKVLTEQRAGLERQLSEQRAALERQLQEQRDEASRQREFLAISDLVAAVQLGANTIGSEQDLGQVFANTEAAVTRWGFEIASDAAKTEFDSWPPLLWMIQTQARVASFQRSKDPATYASALNAVVTATATVVKTAKRWPSASEVARSELLHNMATVRVRLAAEAEQLKAAVLNNARLVDDDPSRMKRETSPEESVPSRGVL